MWEGEAGQKFHLKSAAGPKHGIPSSSDSQTVHKRFMDVVSTNQTPECRWKSVSAGTINSTCRTVVEHVNSHHIAC